MMGQVGSQFGERGINIVSAAVGRQNENEPGEEGLAVMAVTTDAPVPQQVVEEIAAGEGFVEGRTVSL